MGINDRLNEFIDEQGVTPSEFERKCNLGNSYIRNIKGSIGSEKLVNILRVYPNIDLYWLLTGERKTYHVNQQASGDGNTQVAGTGNSLSGDYGMAVDVLKNQLEVKDGQIAKLLELLSR